MMLLTNGMKNPTKIAWAVAEPSGTMLVWPDSMFKKWMKPNHNSGSEAK
jgi:hypothetical protein